MYRITKFMGSVVLASILFSGCSSEDSTTSTPTTTSVSQSETALESIENTKRNLQRELVALNPQRVSSRVAAGTQATPDNAQLAAIIAAFIGDDLTNGSGGHIDLDAPRAFFRSIELDVSELSESEINELYIYSYFGAISESFGVENRLLSRSPALNSGPRRIFGIGTKVKDLLGRGTDAVKDLVVDAVDDIGILSTITEEVFKVMLESGTVTNEMLRMAINSRTITEVMIAVMDDHWNLARKMQPLLEENVSFGHLFMDLAEAHDYLMADFLFSRIDGPMYYSLTRAMTLSRNDVTNPSAGKTTRVLSELMAMPRMAKYFNVPSTLSYTDGQTVEAFSKLLFDNGTVERGDGNELANERFFYEMFATPASTANFIVAMNNIDLNIRIALMDQIFLGESEFADADAMQGHYNIYAIAGGMSAGLGEGAQYLDDYEASLYGFAALVPSSRYYPYGTAFAEAGYAYYRDDNEAYNAEFQTLVYGTMFDISGDSFDYLAWIGLDDQLENETVINRFYEFVLDRDPDEAGFTNWLAKLEAGEDINSVANAFVVSAEAESGALSDELYIQALYTNGFDRDADESGLEHWSNALSSGMSRGEVLVAFVSSDESGGDSWWDDIVTVVSDVDYSSWLNFDEDSLEDETIVNRFYSFVLGREADSEGLVNWVSQLESGREHSLVAKDFVDAAQQESGQLTNTQFVTALYTNGFDREADAEGLTYWVSELDNETNSRGNVLLAFINSEEAGGDSWWDDVTNYFSETSDDAYEALARYFDISSERALDLYNAMSFDTVFTDGETKVQYFISDADMLQETLVTYRGGEYTSTDLYDSENKWAYLPHEFSSKDWIIDDGGATLEMAFSFAEGHVDVYFVSTHTLSGMQTAFSELEVEQYTLDGDEPLSSDEAAIYSVYVAHITSGTTLSLEWDLLRTTTSGIFFDVDNAIVNASVADEQ